MEVMQVLYWRCGRSLMPASSQHTARRCPLLPACPWVGQLAGHLHHTAAEGGVDGQHQRLCLPSGPVLVAIRSTLRLVQVSGQVLGSPSTLLLPQALLVALLGSALGVQPAVLAGALLVDHIIAAVLAAFLATPSTSVALLHLVLRWLLLGMAVGNPVVHRRSCSVAS